MKTNNYFVYLLISFSFLIINRFHTSAQNPFSHTFGDDLLGEKGIASVQLIDGTIYMLGNNSQDITLTKLDENANLIWQKEYGTDGYDYANNILLVDENTFVIVGETYHPTTSNLDGLLLKIDSEGNIIWQKQHGTTTANESLYSIDKTLENGFVTCGFVSGSEGTTGNDILVMVFDENGEVIWQESYGTDLNEVGVAVCADENGDYVISCDKQKNGTFSYNIYVFKVDNQGNMLWNLDVYNENNGGCKNMKPNSKGNFVIVGEMTTATSNYFDAYILEVTSGGELLWQKEIEGTDNGDAVFDVLEVQGNRYLLTGYTYNPTKQQTDIGVWLVDDLGNELDKRYYGNDGYDISYDIIPSNSGGYLVTGASFTNANDQYILISDAAFPMTNVTETHFQSKNLAAIKLFPNPITSEDVTVFFDEKIEKATVKLFDINGKMLWQTNKEIDFSNLTINKNVKNGLYFLQITTPFQTHSFTLQMLK